MRRMCGGIGCHGFSPAKWSYPVRPTLSRQRTITYARVDRGRPAAIFRPLRDAGPKGLCPKAPVAELVDALDSKSSSARSAGSIPARGTSLKTQAIYLEATSQSCVNELRADARYGEIDNRPQLQRQPILPVVDEMNRARL